MKYRVGIWAIAGFLVAGGWALYLFTRTIPLTPGEPMYDLARFTQPFVLASSYLHFGVRFYWALLANAATYALLGLIVESLRRKLDSAR